MRAVEALVGGPATVQLEACLSEGVDLPSGDVDGRVLDSSGAPVPGLFACGETLGGLFSGNYPTGAGLAAGMVIGRRAGTLA